MDNHRHIVILVAGALLLASCSPKIVERIVVQHDTTMVHHRDTTFHRDSIYIREWMMGDTVHIYEYRDRYIYKDRWRDSIVTRVGRGDHKGSEGGETPIVVAEGQNRCVSVGSARCAWTGCLDIPKAVGQMVYDFVETDI